MTMNKIIAPIDNKNLMEDAFEDDVFQDFTVAYDHRNGSKRHLIGIVTHVDEDGTSYNESGIVDVRWTYGDNKIFINVLSVPGTEDYETIRVLIFDDYKRLFLSWQNDDTYLIVECKETRNTPDTLVVSFYFKDEE